MVTRLQNKGFQAEQSLGKEKQPELRYISVAQYSVSYLTPRNQAGAARSDDGSEILHFHRRAV